MKENIHQIHGNELAPSGSVVTRIKEVSVRALRAAQDIMVFAFEPIAYEFRIMREEADECLSLIDRSELNEQGKASLRNEVAQSVDWLNHEKDRHYHQYRQSNPIIAIRHEMERRLRDIRDHLSTAA